MQKLRILVAEHKEFLVARLKALLHGLGHQVVGVAREGGEAAALTGRLQPDLVIVDNQLPSVDGVETARTILTRTAIPIVLLTGYASGDFARRAREAGVMAYLVKPVDRGQLQSAIRVAFARFAELQSLRREVSNVQEALKGKELLEQAKRVLMRRSRLSEAEAFQRMEECRRSAGTVLQAIASRIVKTDELLFRERNFAHLLQVIVRTVRGAELSLPMAGAGGPTAHRFPGGWRQKGSISGEG